MLAQEKGIQNSKMRKRAAADPHSWVSYLGSFRGKKGGEHYNEYEIEALKVAKYLSVIEMARKLEMLTRNMLLWN